MRQATDEKAVVQPKQMSESEAKLSTVIGLITKHADYCAIIY